MKYNISNPQVKNSQISVDATDPVEAAKALLKIAASGLLVLNWKDGDGYIVVNIQNGLQLIVKEVA